MDRLTFRFGLVLVILVGVTTLVVAQWGSAIGLAVGGVAASAIAVLASRRLRARIDELQQALVAPVTGRAGRRLGWTRPSAVAELANTVNEAAQHTQSQLDAASAEQERLRAVLNGMVEGVLVLDRDGTTLLANRRLRELFDAWGNVEGRTPLELIRRPEIDEALSRVSRKEPVSIEIALAADRHVEMHAVLFPDEGRLLGTVAVFHDVTEIRRLEGMRRDFVANVSHELRTPLAAIRGFAETLLGSDVGTEQRDQQLGVILRHSERLSALIEDLLELSRIEGHRTPLELQPVDVAALCRNALRDLQPRFDERQITNQLEVGTTLQASADRRSIEQVLLNLLDNALKYTELGGEIVVTLQDEPGRFRIEVADTGIGIPEADLGRIFERFYRVEKARTRDHGGTGLGLSIVKHLVQAMRGEVFVESREGEGTTVSVRLPLEDFG